MGGDTTTRGKKAKSYNYMVCRFTPLRPASVVAKEWGPKMRVRPLSSIVDYCICRVSIIIAGAEKDAVTFQPLHNRGVLQ